MELAITIIAGVGILLFFFSYLAYLIVAFKHHFITGLIAIFPVLNIVTIPSLWHQNSKKVIAGFIGLSIAIAAWFMGANTGARNLLAAYNGQRVLTNSAMTNNHSVKESNPEPQSHSVFDDDMESLPQKALYKMTFDTVPVDKIGSLLGRIVKITNNSNITFEGQIKSVSASSVLLSVMDSIETEIPIANIKHLSLMVKRAISEPK